MENYAGYSPPQAGAGRRLGAMMVDFFAFLALFCFAFVAFPRGFVLWHAVPWFPLLYYIACEASPLRASFGKRLARIYIGARDGGELASQKALLRACAWFLPLVPAAFLMSLPDSGSVSSAGAGFAAMFLMVVGILVLLVLCIPYGTVSLLDKMTGTRVYRSGLPASRTATEGNERFSRLAAVCAVLLAALFLAWMLAALFG